MQKHFTKDMLETGMVVELKNGIKYIVFKERGVFTSSEGWNYMDSYDERLNSILSSSGHDVIRVYSQSRFYYDALSTSTENRKVVWERQKSVEFTMQEIADKLGISVNSLKIKK